MNGSFAVWAPDKVSHPLPSAELTLSKLPDPADTEAVRSFAQSFDGWSAMPSPKNPCPVPDWLSTFSEIDQL